MDASAAKTRVTPRIIVHGGAGNVTRDNVPPPLYRIYREALLNILDNANQLLSEPNASAIDVAAYAVKLLEENPLFNAGHGAVFTRSGTHELEASIMVSRGLRKRGVGVINVRRTKSPISLAKEMLLRGELEDGGGAQGHSQLQGDTCDRLAEEWGLDTVKPSYYWTRKRWDEHRKGLGLSHNSETYEKRKGEADREHHQASSQPFIELTNGKEGGYTIKSGEQWNGKDYLPQGTVGAVVLDASGTLCVATSTGGLTNKLVGRVGDTPTIGAGFFAEQWSLPGHESLPSSRISPLSQLARMVYDCFPSTPYKLVDSHTENTPTAQLYKGIRAVAISGTGNGDSFLRTSAARTATAIAQYSDVSLRLAILAVAGPNGILQRSAEDRWGETGEGEGGMIGIELYRGEGFVVADFNCGGMFHAFIDDAGKAVFRVFRE